MHGQLIITHPGSAHFDEVTAVGLVLAAHPRTIFDIERREPTQDELDDPGVWVIDTGNRYEPEKRNFDHHQSLESPAGFVLVADYLGLAEILSILPWWHFKDSVDRFGPVIASRNFNAGDDLVNRNPCEDWLVNRFAADPSASLPLLRSFGSYIINSAHSLKKQLDIWRNSRRVIIKGISAIISEARESTGLEEFRRLENNPPGIVISMDRRGEGWRLYRFDDIPVDFSLIADRPEIEFAHKNGFMAKTKEKLSEDRLIELVSQAVTR